MKKMIILTLALIVAFLSVIVAPTYASAPTAIENVWFVVPIFVSSNPTGGPISFVADKVWTSGDGTILHSRGTLISTYIARSPPGAPGSVRIGTITAECDFVFNTLTEKGTVSMKMKVNLTASSNPLYPNPYGVGTLEGSFVADVKSLNPYASIPLPGNANGSFVATHGTGAFENAKLVAAVII